MEQRHDFLWRPHRETPARGMIQVFNRSHYEDVLVARVKELVPRKVWKRRYDHINAFEKLLTDEGTAILKFYLHIGKDYQKQRLERRLAKASKRWKFSESDLRERRRWEEYMTAYEEMLGRCSPAHAPWFVVPAERRWYRDLVITQALVDTLESMELQIPETDLDPEKVEIR